MLITCQFLTRDNNGNNEYEYSNGIIMQNKFDKMSDLQTSIKAMWGMIKMSKPSGVTRTN